MSGNLARLADRFRMHGDYISAVPHGSGHINDTYLVTRRLAGRFHRYILQRINHQVFTDPRALMENQSRVCEHIQTSLRRQGVADPERRSLRLVRTRDNRLLLLDPQGNAWRCYDFIERSISYDVVRTERQAYEAGRCFGTFQHSMSDLPGGPLIQTIADFHNTPRYLARLNQALRENPIGRAADAEPEISFVSQQRAIADVLLAAHRRGQIPMRVIHNDTKLNNVLFDQDNDEGLCVVDLDTVMPGLAPYDFGDLVRSSTISCNEDEQDLSLVECRLPIFEALLKGYLAGTNGMLNPAEIAHLAISGALLAFELGLRFLSDYLTGDSYFKTDYPLQNLYRCRVQFKLVESMQMHREAMLSIVSRHT